MEYNIYNIIYKYYSTEKKPQHPGDAFLSPLSSNLLNYPAYYAYF